MSNVNATPPDSGEDQPTELNKVLNGICQQFEGDNPEKFVSYMFFKVCYHRMDASLMLILTFCQILVPKISRKQSINRGGSLTDQEISALFVILV